MNEAIFSAASLAAIVGWLCLALAATLRANVLRQRLLLTAGCVIPLTLCLLYTCLLIIHWRSANGGGFSSLSAVVALFSAPGKMLGGWTHFLAFDLLVGWWIVDNTFAKGRSRLPLCWVLPATFMYGPLGLLLHTMGRTLLR